MSLDNLYTIIILLALFFIIEHGRAQYWKSKYETLNEERPENGGGWRNEALFLRQIVNKEAADKAEELNFDY